MQCLIRRDIENYLNKCWERKSKITDKNVPTYPNTRNLQIHLLTLDYDTKGIRKVRVKPHLG